MIDNETIGKIKNNELNSLKSSFIRDAEEAEVLSEALKVNRSLKLINLNGANIGVSHAGGFLGAMYTEFAGADYCTKGVIALTEALKKNYILTSLDLVSNRINAQSATALAEFIKIHPTLTSLNLRDNNLGLRTNRFWRNQIPTSKGAKALAEALMINPSLTSLNLSYNNFNTKSIKILADALAVNRSLAYLNLSGNAITTEGLKAISKSLTINSSLVSLDLSNNIVTAEDHKAIADGLTKNRSLRSLTIRGARYSPHILNAILQNDFLEELNVDFPLPASVSKKLFENAEKNRPKREMVSVLLAFDHHVKIIDQENVEKVVKQKAEKISAIPDFVTDKNSDFNPLYIVSEFLGAVSSETKIPAKVETQPESHNDIKAKAEAEALKSWAASEAKEAMERVHQQAMKTQDSYRFRKPFSTP